MESSSMPPVVGATAPPPEAFADVESPADAAAPTPAAAATAATAATLKRMGSVPLQPMPGLGVLGVHEAYVRSLVRRAPDWPKKGTAFLDMNPLLADARALKQCIDSLAERYGGGFITHVAGIDARGFTVGCALAYALNCGFIMVRKKGKLPPGPEGSSSILSEDYELEYGKDTLEVASDSFDTARVTSPRVVLVDDLLATGGTATAACNLLRLAGATIVEVAVVMEIVSESLKGRRRLKEEAYIDAHALLTFCEE